MEQRDYLMRQIEQLGQVLARALARLLNLKQVPDAGLGLDEIRQVYRDELDLELELILATPVEEIVDWLNSRRQYMDRHLETMAVILEETADIMDHAGEHDPALDLRKKCIAVYEYLQQSTGNYSIEWMTKIENLRGYL
jgi:hypothetical protein